METERWNSITEQEAARLIYRNERYFRVLNMKVHSCMLEIANMIVEYCIGNLKYQVNLRQKKERYINTARIGSSWTEWRALA